MNAITPLLDKASLPGPLVDDAPFAIGLVDDNLRYVYVNKMLAELNRLPAEDHFGLTIHEVLGEMAQKLEPILRGVLSSGKAESFEVLQTVAGKIDTPRDFSFSYFPVNNYAGMTYAVGCYIVDTTAANEASRKLRLLSDSMQDIVSLHDADGNFLYVSPSCTTHLGYLPEELIGKNAYELIHPGDHERIRKESHDLVLKGEVMRITYRALTKSGSVKWLEALSTPVFDDSGRVRRIQASLREVTDLVERKNALQESEERLRVTIDAMQDGLILRGADGNVIFSNEAANRIHGFGAGEMFGKLSELPVHYREDGTACPYEDYPFFYCMRTGKSVHGMVLGFKDAEGNFRWLSFSSSPLFQEGSDRPYAVASTMRDITDRKKMLQREAEQRTADEMQRLSDRLIAVQEHERRKIAADLHDEIGGALTGLKLHLESSKKVQPHLISSRLDQATMIVQDMIGEVRQMSMDLRPTVLDYQGLVPALEWYFKRFTSQTGIRISFRLHRVVGRMRPETEVTLYRVIQEALTNIAKYAGVDRAVVSITKSSDSVKVSVRDHGSGFDSAELIKKLDSSGLAGIRERLRLVGGKFQLTTSPGKGTRLVAELPIADETEINK